MTTPLPLDEPQVDKFHANLNQSNYSKPSQIVQRVSSFEREGQRYSASAGEVQPNLLCGEYDDGRATAFPSSSAAEDRQIEWDKQKRLHVNDTKPFKQSSLLEVARTESN